ncbi:MAG: hypothetical protein M1818_007619 [Claussenomyces sp. TS43310]|nr:MAG: hypothetical protein M1818_007619 [Claussenomyces sp. TS43310]
MAINNMATINRPSGVSGIEGSDGHGVANSLSEKVPVDREAKMQGPLNNEAALHMEHEKDSSKRAFSEHCPSSYKMAAEFTLQATDPKERSKYEPEYRNASLGTSVTAFSPLVDYDAPKVLQEVFVDKVQNYIYPHDRPLPAFGVRNGTREDLDGVSGKDRAVEESDVNFSIMRLDGSRSIYDESPNNVFAVDDKVRTSDGASPSRPTWYEGRRSIREAAAYLAKAKARKKADTGCVTNFCI